MRCCRPDAVLLGGDLVDGDSELSALRHLVARLQEVAPVFAIGGNHDQWVGMGRVRGAVVQGGGQWIHDAGARLSHRGRTIAISGPGATPRADGDVRILCAPMSDLRATFVSMACLLRGLPLFFRSAPRTPLRALGIIALDTLHVLRYSRPLAAARVDELAMFLDLEGCTNALWDHKQLCAADYLAIKRQLERAGLGPCIDAFLERLRELEGRRPSIGGDARHFAEVRAYREAVARLSLHTAATLALGPDDHEDEGDVDTLFRILMQCQIIDDVMDYAEDAAAGRAS